MFFFSYDFILFNRWKNCLPKIKKEIIIIEEEEEGEGVKKKKEEEKLFGTFLSEKRMYNINFFFYCRYNSIYIVLWHNKHNKKIFVVEIEK